MTWPIIISLFNWEKNLLVDPPYRPFIDQTKFKTVLDDPNALEQPSGMRDALIAFTTEQLATNQCATAVVRFS